MYLIFANIEHQDAYMHFNQYNRLHYMINLIKRHTNRVIWFLGVGCWLWHLTIYIYISRPSKAMDDIFQNKFLLSDEYSDKSIGHISKTSLNSLLH